MIRMEKEEFNEKLKDLILAHPPEIAVWGNIFRLEGQGRFQEAEKLKKEYFGPKESGYQYVRDFVEERIFDPISKAYKSLFKHKPTF